MISSHDIFNVLNIRSLENEYNENNDYTGEWKYYDKTGNVELKCNYKNGKREGFEISYDRNDLIRKENLYKNNRLVK